MASQYPRCDECTVGRITHSIERIGSVNKDIKVEKVADLVSKYCNSCSSINRA